jgi:hypothetical protein
MSTGIRSQWILRLSEYAIMWDVRDSPTQISVRLRFWHRCLILTGSQMRRRLARWKMTVKQYLIIFIRSHSRLKGRLTQAKSIQSRTMVQRSQNFRMKFLITAINRQNSTLKRNISRSLEILPASLRPHLTILKNPIGFFFLRSLILNRIQIVKRIQNVAFPKPRRLPLKSSFA